MVDCMYFRIAACRIRRTFLGLTALFEFYLLGFLRLKKRGTGFGDWVNFRVKSGLTGETLQDIALGPFRGQSL